MISVKCRGSNTVVEASYHHVVLMSTNSNDHFAKFLVPGSSWGQFHWPSHHWFTESVLVVKSTKWISEDAGEYRLSEGFRENSVYKTWTNFWIAFSVTGIICSDHSGSARFHVLNLRCNSQFPYWFQAWKSYCDFWPYLSWSSLHNAGALM